jgi:hypothetical protein
LALTDCGRQSGKLSLETASRAYQATSLIAGALSVEEMPEELRNDVMTLWAGDNVHAVHYPLRGGQMYNLAATFQSKRFSAGWESFGEPEELFDRSPASIHCSAAF